MSSYIKRSDYAPIAVTREPQLEVTEQMPNSKPEINTGIANAPDQFEAANLSDVMQQPTSSELNDRFLRPPAQTIDCFSLFDYALNMQDAGALTKEEAKDLTGEFTDAIDEGQKTERAVKRAVDFNAEIRKDD